MLVLIVVAAIVAVALILSISLALWSRARGGLGSARCETGHMVKGHLVEDRDACDAALATFEERTKPMIAAWHEMAEDMGVHYTLCGDSALGYVRARVQLPWVDASNVRTDEHGFRALQQLFEGGATSKDSSESHAQKDKNREENEKEKEEAFPHHHTRLVRTTAGQEMHLSFRTDTDVFELQWVTPAVGHKAAQKHAETVVSESGAGCVRISFPLELALEMERVMPQGTMPYARYAAHPRSSSDDAEKRLLQSGTETVEFEGVNVRVAPLAAMESYAAAVYGEAWSHTHHPSVDAATTYPTVLHAVFIPWNRRTQELLEDTETFDRTWLDEQQRSAPAHWEVRLWTYERLRVFCEQYYPTMWDELWHHADRPVQVVDTLRMLLVYHFGGASVQYGGVWMRRDWDEVFLPMKGRPTRLFVETYFPETERVWTKNYRINNGVPDDHIRLVLIYSAMPRSPFMWSATCVAVERIRKHAVVEDYDVLYINGNTMFSSVYDRCSEAEKDTIELVPKAEALALFEVRSTGSWRCNGNRKHKMLQKRKKMEAANATAAKAKNASQSANTTKDLAGVLQSAKPKHEKVVGQMSDENTPLPRNKGIAAVR